MMRRNRRPAIREIVGDFLGDVVPYARDLEMGQGPVRRGRMLRPYWPRSTLGSARQIGQALAVALGAYAIGGKRKRDAGAQPGKISKKARVTKQNRKKTKMVYKRSSKRKLLRRKRKRCGYTKKRRRVKRRYRKPDVYGELNTTKTLQMLNFASSEGFQKIMQFFVGTTSDFEAMAAAVKNTGVSDAGVTTVYSEDLTTDLNTKRYLHCEMQAKYITLRNNTSYPCKLKIYEMISKTNQSMSAGEVFCESVNELEDATDITTSSDIPYALTLEDAPRLKKQWKILKKRFVELPPSGELRLTLRVNQKIYDPDLRDHETTVTILKNVTKQFLIFHTGILCHGVTDDSEKTISRTMLDSSCVEHRKFRKLIRHRDVAFANFDQPSLTITGTNVEAAELVNSAVVQIE